METFFNSISGVLIIIGMVGVGFALAKKGWFDEKSSALIVRLVTQIALPCYMIYTITNRFSSADLIAMLPQLRYPALSMFILLLFAILIAHLFSVDKRHRGLFISMFFNSNTVFVGLPINQAIFGDDSIPYVLVYYMCNTTFFWTIGTYLIQKDSINNVRINWLESIKKLFSPPLLGFLFGVFLVLSQISLPNFIMSDLEYLGNLSVPLSMLFIGMSIAKIKFSHIALSKDMFLVLLGRFLIAPILMALIVLPTSLPLLMKQVFIIQSAMPVMTSAPVIAKMYGGDTEYAAIMVTETTLITMIVTPILMLIINILS